MQIKTQHEYTESVNTATLTLIEQMHHACLLDHQAIKNGQKAMNRFAMIDYVTDQLKKKQIQEIFLEMQGCRILEMWLC